MAPSTLNKQIHLIYTYHEYMVGSNMVLSESCRRSPEAANPSSGWFDRTVLPDPDLCYEAVDFIAQEFGLLREFAGG